MLRINLDWDAKALAAPQSFRDGVQQAANILEAAIYDPITINIEVGYGEYDLNGPDATQLTFGYSLGGIEGSIPISYTALRAVLAAKASTAADVQAVAALPNTASLDGQSTFYISSALAKAFGAVDPGAAAIDGYIGFPTTFTGNGLVGTAITEELHAAGLMVQAGDLGLFAYTSPGTHFLPTGATSATPAYFSMDGGLTRLANYAVGQDETLFSGQPNDPLDFPNQGIVLTPLDLEEISAIGFDVTAVPVLAAPGLTPDLTPDIVASSTPPGTPPALTVRDISVAQGHAISALSMLASVSMPGGSGISGFAFYDDGSGNGGSGHFALDGVTQPGGQFVFVLATQLDTLTYVGGSTVGSEDLAVAAFDYATDSYSPLVHLTATTTQATAASVPQSDFDGDGTSDLLLQNADGDVAAWRVDGQVVRTAVVLGSPGPSWHVAGTGDFDGDGRSDLLFQNDDGTVATWTMAGSAVAGTAIVADPGPSWHAAGTGDFDGDGRSDVLFQNDDGTVAIWTMNGTAIEAGTLVANPGTSWHAVGAGDFDGNGKSDILFRNDDGTIAVWEMDGAAIRIASIVANPGSNWRVAGTADLDGDGKSDIVLQADDGTVAAWMMDGTAIRASGLVANPGSAWHATAAGSYAGRGSAGIALQNDDGSVALWRMSGSSLASSTMLANPGSIWQVTGEGGMHFIDATRTSGTVAGTILGDDFEFTSFTPGAHTIAGFDPLHDVITLNFAAFPSYAAVQAHATQAPGGVSIDLGGGSLLLANVAASALSARNFV